MARFIILLTSVLLVGCAMRLSTTPNSIAVYGLPNTDAVTSEAESHCERYGKIAQIHEISYFWGTTIFHCVEE